MKQDLQDAQNLCEQIGINLTILNFSEQYWNKVFKVFLKEYQIGNTPNPDILCNKEIKFKVFLDFACKEMQADYIATGHYARRVDYQGKSYHQGLMYYTIGQRKGLNINNIHNTCPDPWYVADKNIKKNYLITVQGRNHLALLSSLNMNISPLIAISPIEGRYHSYTTPLRSIFSELAFLKFRLKVEIKWFEALSDCDEILALQPLNNIERKFIKDIINNFDLKDAERIKEIELKTKHDIKMIRQYQKLRNTKILGKFNGTVGNYNAHNIAYPNFDWINFNQTFISNFGITPNLFTTQIEPHDYIVEILNCISHFNNILIGFNQDIWTYISRNYLINKSHINEIGSSVMPHKINPIDFENSEGNLELSNAILNFLSQKLPISRLQRDLTDSTVLRNIGVAISYSFIAYQKMLNGFKKLEINISKIKHDLYAHWEILSEPIQILMRRNKIQNSYELLSEEDKKILKNITPDKYIGLSAQLVRQFKKYVKHFDILKM
uniref:Adenylosuccinate lyase n=1 Tax=Glossina pallidipes TaxID=7398 RepID=A0A1A9Z1A2_GLOPL